MDKWVNRSGKIELAISIRLWLLFSCKTFICLMKQPRRKPISTQMWLRIWQNVHFDSGTQWLVSVVEILNHGIAADFPYWLTRNQFCPTKMNKSKIIVVCWEIVFIRITFCRIYILARDERELLAGKRKELFLGKCNSQSRYYKYFMDNN